ncbi:MAG: hypothetical protein O2800_03980 [Planctomycetota bacterium]|nr:hypothetical protein [Planctomycetota bacterium]
MSSPLRVVVFIAWAMVLSVSTVGSAQCGLGDCLAAHPGGGCEDLGCCESVCAFDPPCCDVGWDAGCASTADSTCHICGSTVSGTCFGVHSGPACDDLACCQTVCAVDPFCCAETWDGICALYAGNLCSTTSYECGDPAAGDCAVPHGNPACANLDCCTAVCQLAPECCSATWDFICVALSQSVCVPGGCTVDCVPDAPSDGELCPTSNVSCLQAAVPLTLDLWYCADAPVTATSADLDLYSFNAIDSDGDGLARVTLTLQSMMPTYAALVSTACGSWTASPLVVQTQLCGPVTVQACVTPGAWKLVVRAGQFPAASTTLAPCGESRYTFIATVDQVCGEVCGTGGSCFAENTAPGCSDAACCEAVCLIDPLCCSNGWDAPCAKLAGVTCTSGPPLNDACANASDLVVGDNPYVMAGSTLDGPPLNSVCSPTGAANVIRDVWFRLANVHGSVTVSTCGGTLHPLIQFYEVGCAGLIPLSCASAQLGVCSDLVGTRIDTQLTCASQLLVRVGILPGMVGDGNIRVTGLSCGGCMADLNQDGAINGADLALVVGNWGGLPLNGGDANGDGIIDGSDLSSLLGAWGPCP